MRFLHLFCCCTLAFSLLALPAIAAEEPPAPQPPPSGEPTPPAPPEWPLPEPDEPGSK